MGATYAEKLQARRQKIKMAIIAVVLFLFLSVIAYALFGETGILSNMRVSNEYSQLVDERERLLAENQQLEQEIQALKTNKRAIEALGRKDFGFGRPGEIIFWFPDDQRESIYMYENQASTPDSGSP